MNRNTADDMDDMDDVDSIDSPLYGGTAALSRASRFAFPRFPFRFSGAPIAMPLMLRSSARNGQHDPSKKEGKGGGWGRCPSAAKTLRPQKRR
jgi:hypothetical protein